MKVHIRLQLFCILFSIVITQCGCGASSQTVEEVANIREDAITIWAWDENFNILAANIATEKYTQSHKNVTFEVVTMSQEETVAKMKSALLSGADNLLPDIVLIEDYRIQYFLKHFEDKFENLNDIVTEDAFASYKMGVNQVSGNIYGVPFDSGVVGLFYRLDDIEAAGYCEEDMRNLTWEKYIQIGKDVKEKTGKYMLTLDPSDLPLIRMMLQSAGEWYCDEEGNINIANNQALKDALSTYQDIVASGIAKPISDWDQFVQAFQNAQVASVISGAWISPTIAEKQKQSNLWRVAEFPSMEKNGNSINASSVGGSGWYVLKNGSHTKEAKRFLQETFVTDVELIDELVEKINLVSTLKSAEDSGQYQKGVEFYGNQTIFQDFIKWTYYIPSVNYGENTYEMEQYVAEGIQGILAGENVEETLRNCQKNYLQNVSQ